MGMGRYMSAGVIKSGLKQNRRLKSAQAIKNDNTMKYIVENGVASGIGLIISYSI